MVHWFEMARRLVGLGLGIYAETNETFRMERFVVTTAELSENIKRFPCIDGCVSAMFCNQNMARPLFQPSAFWDHVTLTVVSESGTVASGVCLIDESEDSHFSLANLFDTRGVEEKLNMRSKTLGGEGGIFTAVVQLLTTQSFCKTRIAVSPFGLSCVRILGASESDNLFLDAELHRSVISYPLILALGLAVIHLAPILSEQILFYYISGITIGFVLSAFLICRFLVNRITPSRRSAFWIAAVFQQTVFGACAFWFNLAQSFASQYPNVVMAGFVVCFFASFGMTHYMLRDSTGAGNAGPTSSFKDMVRWAIKLFGYALVANSSASTQCAISIFMVVTFALNLLPTITVGYTSFLFWLNPNRDIKPLKVKYLARPYMTQQAYQEEGAFYTSKEASSLYNSNQFQEWLMNNMDRVTVSPTKP